MDPGDNGYLTRLENLQFSLSKTEHMQPSSQADVYRNLYLHLSEAEHSTSFLGSSAEAGRNAEMYANTIDNMDESGLNNFAAGALSLCHYYKNDSSKWQTSLSVHKILSLPGFQQKKKISEVEKNGNKCHLIVPIKLKRKAAEKAQGSTSSEFPRSPQDDLSKRTTSFLPTSTIKNTNECNYTKPKPANALNINGKQNVLTLNNTKRDWNTSQSANSSRPFEKQNVPSFGMNKERNNGAWNHQRESREAVTVNASKVGGPYANFGQRRKAQNDWNNGKGGGKSEDEEDGQDRSNPFRTARDQLIINQQKKYGNSGDRQQVTGSNYGAVKKSLGTRRGPANKFVPPVVDHDVDSDRGDSSKLISSIHRNKKNVQLTEGLEEEVDERLKGIDPNMIELIKNDIMDQGAQITWSDIAGLEFAKKTIQEIVVWPMLRPDIFTGLRGPPKGLLLFGPPGTGKTLIGKCIASQSKSTFFCISASSLTSKWVGEGEKMVRALFAVARCSQPAVVFIDEVDSLLSQRSDSEHESSRRIKTEFLVQLDGASTASDERLLVIGATNRPQEIDEAARRRFVKRLLIPLPESIARSQIISNLMSQQRCNLSDSDLQHICDKTEGYSGADMSNLCREAALGPIRSISFEEMETITPDQVRPILRTDFDQALLQVRASVSSKDLELYVDWNKTYGSFGF